MVYNFVLFFLPYIAQDACQNERKNYKSLIMREIKFLARCVGVWKVWNLWGNSVELFPKKVGNDLWGSSFWHAFGTALAH